MFKMLIWCCLHICWTSWMMVLVIDISVSFHSMNRPSLTPHVTSERWTRVTSDVITSDTCVSLEQIDQFGQWQRRTVAWFALQTRQTMPPSLTQWHHGQVSVTHICSQYHHHWDGLTAWGIQQHISPKNQHLPPPPTHTHTHTHIHIYTLKHPTGVTPSHCQMTSSPLNDVIARRSYPISSNSLYLDNHCTDFNG